MTRQEMLNQELVLKSDLRAAINSGDVKKEEKARTELADLRDKIGSRTVEEAYGAMAY